MNYDIGGGAYRLRVTLLGKAAVYCASEAKQRISVRIRAYLRPVISQRATGFFCNQPGRVLCARDLFSKAKTIQGGKRLFADQHSETRL
jgi:hypothetical protein